ncbi:MAG: 16S rRNA (cytidine(1402)-2'-O)-methyltransferase, partial [Candidatus Eremiobacterota bacterium]
PLRVAVGPLYVVATPIGNLGDLSPRAREVLASVDLVAGETEASTRRLLSALGLSRRTALYQERNREWAGERLVAQLLEGGSIALVSDGGTPGLSDPGRDLVARCHRSGIPVRAIPGPSALTAALSVCGLPARRIAFEGFLPRKRSERRTFLEGLRQEPRTLVLFESPARLREALEDLRDVLGDRSACLARELTKLHEEVRADSLTGLLECLTEPRGECCLVVEGAPPVREEPDYAEQARQLVAMGLGARTAARVLQLFTPLPRKEAYRLCLALAKGGRKEVP